MSFIGSTFIFDSIPSETHDLYIANPDGGELDVAGSGGVELITQEIWRRPVPYLFGVRQTPTLSFDVMFWSPRELSAVDISIISKWLFGNVQYKKLQIVQPDMTDIYFNCVMNNPRIYKVGNVSRGIKATVQCDAPWAWEIDRTLTWSWSGGGTVAAHYLDFATHLGTSYYIRPTDNYAIPCFYNNGDNNDYIYPIVEFIMNSTGGGMSMTSPFDTDENGDARVMEYPQLWPLENPISQRSTNLSPFEKIVMDNDRKIITSYTLSGSTYVRSGYKRFERFQHLNETTNRIEKNWFRFKPGANIIIVSGNITNLSITYRIPRKISG